MEWMHFRNSFNIIKPEKGKITVQTQSKNGEYEKKDCEVKLLVWMYRRRNTGYFEILKPNRVSESNFDPKR